MRFPLNEPRALILAAFITGLFSIAAVVVGSLLVSSSSSLPASTPSPSSSVNGITASLTPDHTASGSQNSPALTPIPQLSQTGPPSGPRRRPSTGFIALDDLSGVVSLDYPTIFSRVVLTKTAVSYGYEFIGYESVPQETDLAGGILMFSAADQLGPISDEEFSSVVDMLMAEFFDTSSPEKGWYLVGSLRESEERQKVLVEVVTSDSKLYGFSMIEIVDGSILVFFVLVSRDVWLERREDLMKMFDGISWSPQAVRRVLRDASP